MLYRIAYKKGNIYIYMAKFKCQQSGNVFEFFTEHDIKTMRTHSEYEEVPEVVQDKALDVPVPTKKVGRPAKPKEE